MAVTTTVQDIFEAAYSRSTQNMPGTIATESTELLAVVQRALDGCYAMAARINPTFFAASASVTPPGAATPWARPETAESIFRIEDNADASEVVVVPYDDRTAESGLAAVYEWGQGFYEAGNAGDPDPATVTLDFYYSKRPDTLTAITDTLDDMWTEQFNELLVLEVAIYLATKDGAAQSRGNEMQVFVAERLRWANRFTAFLEHATPIQRRRYGHVRRFNTEAMLPVFGFADINATK
jgi:hypothetical protein